MLQARETKDSKKDVYQVQSSTAGDADQGLAEKYEIEFNLYIYRSITINIYRCRTIIH